MNNHTHAVTFRGPFKEWRENRYWEKHKLCYEYSCDSCSRKFIDRPDWSSNLNGKWYCSFPCLNQRHKGPSTMSYLLCDRCQKESPQDQINKDLITDGMVLMLDGYYNAFYDTIDGIPSANICHDCVGEIWRSIPKFAEYGKKLHCNSGTQDKPCCEFGN